MYDIIIIGGGPAGLTAALYARRADKSVLIIEKNAFGGQMTNSPKIENYPGFVAISGSELADKMLESVLEKGADVELAEVKRIENGDIKKVITEYGDYEAKAVIIATGVKHRSLGLANEEKLIGKGVYFCAVCDGGYFKDKNVILVGGGNSALQEAILLADTCQKVTIVQNLSCFTGEAKLISVVNGRKNIQAVFDSTVTEIIATDKFEGIKIKNSVTNIESTVYADGMFVAIGLIPDNERFENVASLEKHGYFDSNESCKTNNEGVFTAGDCRTKSIRQIVTAVGDGAAAALAACKYIDSM